jgi:excisionase family DNA binding protein
VTERFRLGQDRPTLAVVEHLVLTAPADPYLSLAKLAEYSGLSRRTLRKFLDRNPPAQALPCYRLDGKVLVRRSDFDTFMEQYRTQGRPGLVRVLRELGLDKRPV